MKSLYKKLTRAILAGTLLFAFSGKREARTESSVLEQLLQNTTEPIDSNRPGEAFDELMSLCDELISILQVKKEEFLASGKRAEEYKNQFSEIKERTENGDYTNVSADIRSLADSLKEEIHPNAQEILEQVKGFTYIRLVKVDAKYERKMVKEGHYEQVSVPPEYKTEKNLRSTAPLNIFRIPSYLGAMLLSPSEAKKQLDNDLYKKERVRVKDGYFKQGKWIEPVYENVLVSPAHQEEVEINPYLRTQRVIQDNITIKE